jgi:hypothetical protein
MISKYLESVKRREEWESTLRAQREARPHKAQAVVSMARFKLERAQLELSVAEEDLRRALNPPERLHDLPPIEPSQMLLAACGAINDAACRGEPLDFHTSLSRGFKPLTGAALATALSDAEKAGWVGRTPTGCIYWRDAGLSHDCPLVLLAGAFS